MNTTKLSIEFVIAGVIIILALLLFIESVFPFFKNAVAFININSDWFSANWVLLTVITTAIFYGFGIISEYIGLIMFEGLLDFVKEKRMQSYIKANPIIVKKSPLLTKYKFKNSVKMTRREISSFYGDMRFHVMMKSSLLYSEIEFFLNRFEFVRVLFLGEVIVFIALIINLAKNFSIFTVICLIFTVLIAWANFHAIKYLFEYYCRAIERSYKALLIESFVSLEKPRNNTPSLKRYQDEE